MACSISKVHHRRHKEALVDGNSSCRQRSRRRQVKPAELDDELYYRIASVVEAGDEISTLSIKRPNWISSFDRTGVWVETERSRARGLGPQLVPAWMIALAWDRLSRRGVLSHAELLNEMNVKRSAFVCALLAQFPDVVVRQTQPTVLGLLTGNTP